jgi:MFS family permease
MGWFVLPRDAHQPVAAGRRLDIPGAVALFLTLATGLLAINRGQAWGWTSPVILGSFTVSVASLATFVLVERRSASPVVSLALFRVRAYTTGVSSLVLNFAGQSTTTFLMPFYLIAVRGYSTAHTGLIIATVPSMMLLLSPLSGWLSDRFHFRHQVTIGLVIVTAGLALLATVSAGTPDTLIMARLAVVGIGTSVFMSPNSSQIMGSVPRAMLGTASASVATARNIGTATGLAISGAVLIGVATASAGVASASSVTDLPDDALLDGIKAAFLVASLVSSTAVVASLFRNPVRSTPVALAPLPRPPVGEAAEPGGTSAGS